MSTLYNLRHDGDQYRITKWIDGNPEASYLCDLGACECPAGVRPTCRHRQMLPRMLTANLLDSPAFWDHDRNRTCDIDGRAMTLLKGPEIEPIERSIEQEQAYNRAVTAAGGTITTKYMRDGSIETEITIPHEAKPAQPWRRI